MLHSLTKKTCMCCEEQTVKIIVLHKTRRQTHGLCYDCCHAYISPKIELLFNLLRQELPINLYIDCCGSVNGQLRNQCKVKFNILDISCKDVDFPLYDDLTKLRYLISNMYLKLCQNKDCGSIIEITPPINIYDNQVTCPLCKVTWCKTCLRQPYHFGKTCIQVELEDNYSEYAQTINKKIEEGILKKCPQCQVPTEKERDNDGNFVGCNKITCTHCGIKWCWLCNATNIGYEHFNVNNNAGCANRLWEGVPLQ